MSWSWKRRVTRVPSCALADWSLTWRSSSSGWDFDVGEVQHVDVDQIHFGFETKGWGLRLADGHALRVIRRDEFDNWLAGKARERGIEMREGVSVRSIRVEPGGVRVETDQGNFRTQIVVGADGSNGVTRRCMFPCAPMHTARVLEIITPASRLPVWDLGGEQLPILISYLSPITLPVISGIFPHRSTANPCDAGEFTIRISGQMGNARP